MKNIIISWMVLLLCSSISMAQVFVQGKPVSSIYKLQTDPPTINVLSSRPKLNNNKSLDSLIDESIIGRTQDFDVNIKELGQWDTIENFRILRLQISSISTEYTMFIFSEFQLPKNSELYIYNRDKSWIQGAFTEANNNINGRFSTAPIKGEELIFEYSCPLSDSTDDLLNLKIEKIGLLDKFYKSGYPNFGVSQSCMINAKCPEFENWCDQRRSVALICMPREDGFISFCTGSMITNERRDGRPYFLTAFHCLDYINDGDGELSIEEKNTVNDWVVTFNYQSFDCENPSIEPSTIYSISGAQFVNAHQRSDYAVVELSKRPPTNYNVFYNGWTNDNSNPKNGVCIHHPRGDIKKISTYDEARNNTLTDLFYPGHNWKVNWDRGRTQTGSSGSPLFNSEGKTVGQLQGGGSECGNNFADYYGRFDKSWFDYGLNSILNPNGQHSGSNQKFLVSMSGDETCKTNWYFTNANDLHTSSNVNFNNLLTIGTRMYDGVYNAQNNIVAEVVTIQSNTAVSFIAGKSIQLKPGFTAKNGSVFKAKIGNCERGCDGNINNLNSNSDDMIVSTTPYINNESDMLLSQLNSSNLENSLALKEELIISPNPSNGKFRIFVKGSINDVLQIEITDNLGKKILTTSISNGAEIAIPNPKQGVYFVSILNNENSSTQKIVIQ